VSDWRGKDRGEAATPPTPTTPPTGSATGGQDFVLLAVMQVQKEIGAQGHRMEAIERTNRELAKVLEALVPKIEDVYGFAKHHAPHLASKADVEKIRTDLTSEVGKVRTDLTEKIDERPTTVVILSIAALVLAVFGLPFLSDWWGHLKTEFGIGAPPGVSAPASPPQSPN
jgi:hypothetical protein